MLRPNPGDYNLTYWIAQRFFRVCYVGYVTAYVRSGVSGRTVPHPLTKISASNLDKLQRKANRVIDEHRKRKNRTERTIYFKSSTSSA